MRNPKKLFARVLTLVLACVLFVTPISAAYGDGCSAGEMPIPSCGAAYIVELTSGTVVYSDNANEKMYPASTTKLMTALLAVEYVEAGYGSLDDIIIFSEAAVYGIPRDTMHINISVGEKLTVEQVLYAILLPSANEACLGMAEYVAGDISSFIDLMNVRAGELGMAGTHYVTANGLHDEEHYTTAYDMSILMQEVLKHELLVQIMSTAEYTIPETNMSLSRSLSNTNKCIHTGSEYYNPYVICGKTGFTTPAGNTLVTYSEYENQKYISIILKANQGITFSSTDKFMDYVSENVELVKIENLIDYSVSVPTDGTSTFVMAQPAVSFLILSHKGDDVGAYRKEYSLKDSVTLPVYAGDTVGTLYLYDGETLVASVNMVSRANYGVPDETTAATSAPDSTEDSGDESEPPTTEKTDKTDKTDKINKNDKPNKTETTADPEELEKEYRSFGKTIVKILVILLLCIVVCVLIYCVLLAVSIYNHNQKKKQRREEERHNRKKDEQ